LDGPLQTLGFLFRYEIENGSYGRTWFNIGPYGKNGIKNRNLVKDIPMIIHLRLGSVSLLVSEKKIFEISANQSILLALAAMLK
jgi:hypothetical protein